MRRSRGHSLVWISTAVLAAAVSVAWVNDGPGESERKIQESEVPASALKALRELAGKAKITEFAEEIEHGHTYYEGSWKGAHGTIDALVTSTGDLVEIEERIPVEQTPKSVLEAARKSAGKDAQFHVEKKTVVFYELKYAKDGRRHEVVFTPDGRQHEHEDEPAKGDDDADDD